MVEESEGERLCQQLVAEVILERRPVNLVGAAADLNVDSGAAGLPLFGGEAVGDHVDGFDRFERRYIRGDVRQPGLLAGGAVYADEHARGRGTVDIGLERARGIGRHRVGDAADLHGEVDTGGVVSCHDNAGLDGGLETVFRNLNFVSSGLHGGKYIAA